MACQKYPYLKKDYDKPILYTLYALFIVAYIIFF